MRNLLRLCSIRLSVDTGARAGQPLNRDVQQQHDPDQLPQV